MNIAVNLEIDKDEFETFSEAEEFCYATGLRVAREMMKRILEVLDAEQLAERDAGRYRCKGFSKTCLKTMMGDVEYRRRVYIDTATEEGKHCVYLLDKSLQVKTVGQVTENACRAAALNVCEGTYRAAAQQMRGEGLVLSHQAIWNIVQALGRRQRSLTERKAELAKLGVGTGTVETKLLYEEADGIWLKLQGKSRVENGPSKEMKIGIAYDGVLWELTGDSRKRWKLDNKVALAGFYSAEEFRAYDDGVIAGKFKTATILLRVVNGDGAQWIQKRKGVNMICVLDEYHRNRKITECAGNPEFAQTIRTLLCEKKTEDALVCIQAQINSIEDEDQQEKLRDLYRYFHQNKDALLGYYDRGIEIPATREPGVVHHARLGSMESNVYTLIGNRMKGGRATWSIDGANNLALLLCAYHTSGLKELFPNLPPLPESCVEERPEIDRRKPLSASRTPLKEGRGSEYAKDVSTTNSPAFLRGISQFSSLSSMSFC